MVKADAYGLGAIEIAKRLKSDVYGFGVSSLEEGISLRENGIDNDIFVITLSDDEMTIANDYRLTITLGRSSQFEIASRLKSADFCLQLNSGMNRFGFDDVETALSYLEKYDIEISSYYSHLRADDNKQIAKFDEFADKIKNVYPLAKSHLCATNTAYRHKCDFVRIGIGAYKDASTVLSEVIDEREVSNDFVGYGDEKFSGNVAWIAGGYADGFDRERKQNVIIRGIKCAIVAVCMDYSGVLTPFKAQIGEKVTVQSSEYTAEEIAQNIQSIPYKVLTSRKGRIQKIYYD